MAVRRLLRTNLLKNPSIEILSPYFGTNSNVVSDSTVSVNGNYSLKIIPTGASTDTAANTNGTGSIYPAIVENTTYTISGYITLLTTQVGNFHATRTRKIVVFTNAGAGYVESQSTPAPNVPGTYRISITVTTPVGMTEFFVRFYNGSDDPGSPVYWDSLMIEVGSQLNPYFDGSSWETQSRFYKWTGMVGGSTSEEYLLDGSGAQISPGKSLIELKSRMLDIILGPSPTKVTAGEVSLQNMKKAALEKVLSDNGIAV